MGGVKFHPGSIPTSGMPPLSSPPGSASRGPLQIGGMRVLHTARPAPQAVMQQALTRQSDGMDSSRQHVGDKLGKLPAALALAPIRQAAAPAARNGVLAQMKQQLTRLNPFAQTQAVADKEPAKALKDLFAAAPKALRQHANWPNFTQRMTNYLDATRDLQHADLRALLNTPGLDLFGMLGSLKAYSKLDAQAAQDVAFQRDLANIGMMDIAAITASDQNGGDLNASVLGNRKSYVSSHPDSAAVKPGNQVSLAMETLLRRADGVVKKVTVLSSPAPALDSKAQPEWSSYVDAQGRLDPAKYRAGMAGIRDHIRSCAASHAGPRVVLTGIGTSAFLGGLNNDDKATARAIVTEMLADVARDLDALGKQVAFYDKSDAFCNALNERNQGAPSIAFLGKLEASWEEDGDLILNAWDPHSLIGNGLKLDNSGDGILCRHTLLHLMHAMACAMHTEGMI